MPVKVQLFVWISINYEVKKESLIYGTKIKMEIDRPLSNFSYRKCIVGYVKVKNSPITYKQNVKKMVIIHKK